MSSAGKASAKTRTTAAHGPTQVKKVYKASTTTAKAGTTTTATTTARATAVATTTTATAFSHKRKAGHDAASTATTTNDDRTAEPDKRNVVSTLLNTPEEIDFPRGGGTNLTQVEVHEAQLEGEKEAREEENVSSLYVHRRFFPLAATPIAALDLGARLPGPVEPWGQTSAAMREYN